MFDTANILLHDVKRVQKKYDDCCDDVIECAKHVANGEMNYCCFLESAIKKMNETKIELSTMRSAYITIMSK